MNAYTEGSIDTCDRLSKTTVEFEKLLKLANVINKSLVQLRKNEIQSQADVYILDLASKKA